MERSLILLLLTSPLMLFGMGGRPTVVKGEADYQASGGTEVVRVTDKTILEYKNFNIDLHETTRFEQPSDKSTLLCRVYGRNESVIHGKLQANGKLLLVNPNGVFFSETAHVNVGSLIASVLDISNENFLNDKFKFELADGSLKRNITNKGRIEAIQDVVFMAPNVVNQGIITAKTGKIALVVGEAITLDFDGDSMIQFAVDIPFKDGCIEQDGVVIAPEVYMHLPTAQRVIREVVNTTGLIEAGCIVCEEGVIRLKEGSYTSAKKLFLKSGDAIEISGEIQASELCDLVADQEILWMRNNSVERLVTTTPRLVLEGSLSAKEWTHHALDLPATITPYSRDMLERLQLPRDCIPLSIDAPLHLHGDLNVSAPHHELRFLHAIDGSGGLALNVCGVDFKNNATLTGSLKLDVEGTIHFGGTEYVVSDYLFKGPFLNIKTGAGDLTFQGPIVLDSPDVTFQASEGGSIRFNSSLSGNSDLKVHTPEGEIELKGNVGSDTARFKQINLTGKKITQHERVVSTGPVHYTADEAYLGHDINTNASIILDTPVTLFKNKTISLNANKYKGQVILKSTVDAATPETSLTIENGKSATLIEGPIGRNGPLEALKINSGSISLGAVGGKEKGVNGLMEIKSVKAEFKGDAYYAGEQALNVTEKIDFTHTGVVELKTEGNPLIFGNKVHAPKVYLTQPAAFNIDTQGGSLDLGEVCCSTSLPVSIMTGKGDVFLHGVGESGSTIHPSSLVVEGSKITLGGRVEAGTVSMTALEDIIQDNGAPSLIGRGPVHLKSLGNDIILTGHVYGKEVVMHAKNGINANSIFTTGAIILAATDGNIVLSGQFSSQSNPAETILMTAGKNIFNIRPKNTADKENSTPESGEVRMISDRTLFSRGTITLDAQGGSLGQIVDGEQQTISVYAGSIKGEGTEKSFVGTILLLGAKEVSYLEGVCAYGLPYVIASNKPPLVYFNGNPIEPFDPRSSDPLDNPDERGVLKSLHPALSHKTPTAFMDGVAIQPRKAPIYYDISGQ